MRKPGTLSLRKFGLGNLWIEKVWTQNTCILAYLQYSFVKYTFGKYTFGKYSFAKYTFGKYTSQAEEKLRKLRKKGESGGKTEKVEEKLKKLRKN